MATGRRGAYPLTKVLVHRQVSGRFVIMGNAAHTLHPVAGQGFNFSLKRCVYTGKYAGKAVAKEGSQVDLGQYDRFDPL